MVLDLSILDDVAALIVIFGVPVAAIRTARSQRRRHTTTLVREGLNPWIDWIKKNKNSDDEHAFARFIEFPPLDGSITTNAPPTPSPRKWYHVHLRLRPTLPIIAAMKNHIATGYYPLDQKQNEIRDLQGLGLTLWMSIREKSQSFIKEELASHAGISCQTETVTQYMWDYSVDSARKKEVLLRVRPNKRGIYAILDHSNKIWFESKDKNALDVVMKSLTVKLKILGTVAGGFLKVDDLLMTAVGDLEFQFTTIAQLTTAGSVLKGWCPLCPWWWRVLMEHLVG